MIKVASNLRHKKPVPRNVIRNFIYFSTLRLIGTDMETSNIFGNINSLLYGVAVALWLHWLWRRRDLYRFSMQFPGKWGLPLIGVFKKVPKLNDLFPFLKQQFESFNTTCVWLGINPIILTQDPEFIGKVLSSPDLLNKAKIFYDPFHKLFEGGIIASPADKWVHTRKLMNPSFNHKVLLSFLPIFNKAKRLTLSKFDGLVGKGEQKLLDMLQLITLGVSVETTMGKVMKENEELDKDIARKWQYLGRETMKQMISAFLNLDFIYRLNYRFQQTKQYISDYAVDLIREKMKSKQQANQSTLDASAKISSNMKSSKEVEIGIKKEPNIFIDQAIQLYEEGKFTWKDIRSESNSLVATSFETTANSTFAALVMLAMHPEVQDKLYQEIVSVFPDKDFEMEYSHIEQLPYLDMVINEVLRLNPSAPVVARHVVKDTQLTKDVLLPKGLQIVISIFHLHRRADIWGPNAEQFNPDNFLPENLKEKHTYAYIPFSKGIRNCIGWRYAVFSLKVMIAGLVRNYKLTTTFKYEDLSFVNKVALFFKDEPGLEIQRR